MAFALTYPAAGQFTLSINEVDVLVAQTQLPRMHSRKPGEVNLRTLCEAHGYTDDDSPIAAQQIFRELVERRFRQ